MGCIVKISDRAFIIVDRKKYFLDAVGYGRAPRILFNY